MSDPNEKRLEGEWRNMWLAQASNARGAKDPAELLRGILDRLDEWYDRWENLWKRVDPNAISPDKKIRQAWMHENSLKAFGVWHAARDVRFFLKESGLWKGNPMDPYDPGQFIFESSKPTKQTPR